MFLPADKNVYFIIGMEDYRALAFVFFDGEIAEPRPNTQIFFRAGGDSPAGGVGVKKPLCIWPPRAYTAKALGVTAGPGHRKKMDLCICANYVFLKVSERKVE